MNYPDCVKELSYHFLKYDHTKFCKAIQKQPEPEITHEPEIPPSEQEQPPEPPRLVRQKSVTVKAKPTATATTPTKPVITTEAPMQVTHEMIAEQVKHERVAKSQRARHRFSALANSGLP